MKSGYFLNVGLNKSKLEKKYYTWMRGSWTVKDMESEVMDYCTNLSSFAILPETACLPGGAGDISEED